MLIVVENAPVFVDQFVASSARFGLVPLFRCDGIRDERRGYAMARIDLQDDWPIVEIQQPREVLRFCSRPFCMHTYDAAGWGWT